MKKFLFATGILFVLVSITSCSKWDKEKKKEKCRSDYYSVDFKESTNPILGIDVQDIDILYSTFFYEGKDLKYKLVAESSEEENEDTVLAYEEGSADVDDELNITFIPDSNPSESYAGYFQNDKKNYKVSLPGLDERELNFILKK